MAVNSFCSDNNIVGLRKEVIVMHAWRVYLDLGFARHQVEISCFLVIFSFLVAEMYLRTRLGTSELSTEHRIFFFLRAKLDTYVSIFREHTLLDSSS